jgi:hypothetical protein
MECGEKKKRMKRVRAATRGCALFISSRWLTMARGGPFGQRLAYAVLATLLAGMPGVWAGEACDPGVRLFCREATPEHPIPPRATSLMACLCPAYPALTVAHALRSPASLSLSLSIHTQHI